MVYFLNTKGKTHAEDTLQFLFNENLEKIVILGFSIVLRRSPHHSVALLEFTHDQFLCIWPSCRKP